MSGAFPSWSAKSTDLSQGICTLFRYQYILTIIPSYKSFPLGKLLLETHTKEGKTIVYKSGIFQVNQM